MTLRCFSYGGGVQSTAALVLAAQGKQARQELIAAGEQRLAALGTPAEWDIDTPGLDALTPIMERSGLGLDVLNILDFPIFLFANVGDDSEHPDTLRYVEDVARPYAAAQGIELVELRKIISRGPRKGENETVYSRAMADNRTIGIPAYMGNGAPGRRNCTDDFKIEEVNKVLRKRGATAEHPAVIGLGISIDEYQRMRSDDPRTLYVKKSYPLIDLRMTRADCESTIRAAGLPVPPKSSCWFCPFHSTATWRRLQNDRPDLFEKAVEMERRLNEKRSGILHHAVFLTRTLQPLDQALAGRQADMFDDVDDACESGFCMV